MRTIQLKCSRCNAPLPAEQMDSAVITCPYCGSTLLLTESDGVKTARIHADAERLARIYDHREYLDARRESRGRRRTQAVIICIFSVIAAFLVRMLLNASPTGL